MCRDLGGGETKGSTEIPETLARDVYVFGSSVKALEACEDNERS